MNNIEDLSLYYCIEYKNLKGELITEDLIKGGRDILVTNINDYTEKRINFIIKKAKFFVDEIKKSLFKVILL